MFWGLHFSAGQHLSTHQDPMKSDQNRHITERCDKATTFLHGFLGDQLPVGMSILKLGINYNITKLRNVSENLHSWTFLKILDVKKYRLIHRCFVIGKGKTCRHWPPTSEKLIPPTTTATWLHKAPEQPRGPVCTWHSCHCWQRQTTSTGGSPTRVAHWLITTLNRVFAEHPPAKKPQGSPVNRSIANCSASSTHRQERHARYQKHVRLLAGSEHLTNTFN